MSPPGPPLDAGVIIRRASTTDLPAIFALGGRSLGWPLGPMTEAHFAWKHFESPFGPSPMWLAEADGCVVGFRTFLRWEFLHAGSVVHAVRAVDTATDPEYRGRGIFTTLTLSALEELSAEGVDFVFNTPNDQSRPGYLKMGWEVVGRLPVVVRPTGVGRLARVARARTPASRGAVPTGAGLPAAVVFSDRYLVERLLSRPRPGDGLTTRHSVEYLRWRFGPELLHYRVATGPEGVEAGAVVFHLRRRGPALEAVVCETLVPVDDTQTRAAALRQIAKESGADYLIGLPEPQDRWRPRFWSVPRMGPVLTVRALHTAPPMSRNDWRLGLGDIELF